MSLIVWAGVLAAGEGRRMGHKPKALLELGGRTFLENITRTARSAGVDGIAVVLGYHASEVAPLARSLADVVVVNPNPSLGMSSSASWVARALPREASMLLWPVDYPAIRVSTLRALASAARSNRDRIISPICGAPPRTGHPPLLPPLVVDALGERDDHDRLDHFIRAIGGEPLTVEVDDRAVLFDVDRPVDLSDIEELTSARQRKT